MSVTTVTPKAGFIKLRHVMYSILSHVEDRAMGSSFCRDDLFNHGNDEFRPVFRSLWAFACMRHVWHKYVTTATESIWGQYFQNPIPYPFDYVHLMVTI